MKARHARKIRAGIRLAQQVRRRERIGPGINIYAPDAASLFERAYSHTLGKPQKASEKGPIR